MGSFSGWLRGRYGDVSGNAVANFLGAPRATDAPWMALIGVIAAADVDDDGAQQARAAREMVRFGTRRKFPLLVVRRGRTQRSGPV